MSEKQREREKTKRGRVEKREREEQTANPIRKPLLTLMILVPLLHQWRLLARQEVILSHRSHSWTRLVIISSSAIKSIYPTSPIIWVISAGHS